MSGCIKKSYDYELVKNCCRCKTTCLKSSFSKTVNKNDGVNSMCKIWLNKKIKGYMKNRMTTGVSFRLIRNTRRRTHHALNGKLKSSSTLDILGIDLETYRKYIEYQMTPEMNLRNIETYQVKPICLFNVSKHKEVKEAFSWKNTQPFGKKIHKQKGVKYNFLDYQLQFMKANQFVRIHEEGRNQNIHWWNT